MSDVNWLVVAGIGAAVQLLNAVGANRDLTQAQAIVSFVARTAIWVGFWAFTLWLAT